MLVEISERRAFRLRRAEGLPDDDARKYLLKCLQNALIKERMRVRSIALMDGRDIDQLTSRKARVRRLASQDAEVLIDRIIARLSARERWVLGERARGVPLKGVSVSVPFEGQWSKRTLEYSWAKARKAVAEEASRAGLDSYEMLDLLRALPAKLAGGGQGCDSLGNLCTSHGFAGLNWVRRHYRTEADGQEARVAPTGAAGTEGCHDLQVASSRGLDDGTSGTGFPRHRCRHGTGFQSQLVLRLGIERGPQLRQLLHPSRSMLLQQYGKRCIVGPWPASGSDHI